jgi:hypothetical protein
MIVRDMVIKDISNVKKLLDELFDYESRLGTIKYTSNSGNRLELIKSVAMDSVSNPNTKAIVTEKSGRLMGIYIATIEDNEPQFENNPICRFLAAYAKKSARQHVRIVKEIESWAEMKGCKAIHFFADMNNDRMHKLAERQNYKPIRVVYEKEL